MTENQAKKMFEKYNPSSSVVRCPNGRAKMRPTLDLYAKAAVNLYGTLTRSEFVEIFNSQNEDKITCDEVFTILLPCVLKYGWYCFYKDSIVHYALFTDFDMVDYMQREQCGKPRYIPQKEKFLKYEWEQYSDNDYWQNVAVFMLKTFKPLENVMNAHMEIRDYLSHSSGINKLSKIMDKYGIELADENHAQGFIDILMLAKNNTRIWENKGYSPNEMHRIAEKKNALNPVKLQEMQINKPRKIGANERCPCGSGKKYKKCCALTQNSGSAQLAYDDRELFYVTWYKLLDFVNRKLAIVDIKIKLSYPSGNDELKLYEIRKKLWANPKLISDFIASDDDLSEDEVKLLKSWKAHHLKWNFILVKYEPDYAVLMHLQSGKANRLYGVKGMTTSICQSMHQRLPIVLETVLLPFGDFIVYDSFISNNEIEYGAGLTDMFNQEYEDAKKEFGITTKL